MLLAVEHVPIIRALHVGSHPSTLPRGLEYHTQIIIESMRRMMPASPAAINPKHTAPIPPPPPPSPYLPLTVSRITSLFLSGEHVSTGIYLQQQWPHFVVIFLNAWEYECNSLSVSIIRASADCEWDYPLFGSKTYRYGYCSFISINKSCTSTWKST